MLRSMFLVMSILVCATVAAPADVNLPGRLQVGSLVYRASMGNAESVKGWRMEGPGEVSFKDGWMHMHSPDEEMHHVFWCPKRFPESFIAQWDAQNMETDAGLCIVFFAAAGLNDQSIFSDELPERNGNFQQYTKGKIRCYHTSYYANAAHNPDRRQTNLRKNPGFHLVKEGEEGIPTTSEKTHTITLAKVGPHIRLWVDNRKVIDWTDAGNVGGQPHGDGYIGFRQMKWTHFRYRNFRVWSVPDTKDPEDDVNLGAVEQRRLKLLKQGARRPLNLNARDSKQQNPFILARLAINQADEDCLKYLARGARFHGRGSMFGMESLARILAGYEDHIPPEVVEEIRIQVTQFPDFLGGGTENHRAMKRAAGLIFGERWPDETFHHNISGRELAAICRKYVHDYGRQLYASSMREYLSPVYHTVNTNPWLTIAEYAGDPKPRIMARAIVDWMMVDLALNSHQGSIVPPLMRSRVQLKGYPGSNRLHMDPTITTAWLYWGGGIENAKIHVPIESSSVPHHAASKYVPHLAIRNLGAGHVAKPFTLLQSRTTTRSFESIAANPYGYEARCEAECPEYGPLDTRYHMRSVYFEEDYALGVGYFKKNIYDSLYRTMIASGAVWRSKNQYARLVVSHPYWYANYKPQPWESPSPKDMWSGVSPFQQVVHNENTAIFLYHIPSVDPYEDIKLRWGPRWAPPARSEHPMQSCFAYYPNTMEEKKQVYGTFFLREGDVYIAVRPLREDAFWADCAMTGYARIDMPGAVTGCVVEIGDKKEYGSFKAFQNQIANAKLDTTRLLGNQHVSYVSTRGAKLEIQFNHDGRLPDALVNGTPLAFNNWPICESPYVTCRERVLEIHDGKQGLTIDWRGNSPTYTYFDIINGERHTSSREYVNNAGRLIRE